MIHGAKEVMNNVFTKYHIGEGMVIHHFTGVEDEYPHDHPFDFVTHIITGGYVEEIYKIRDGGVWSRETITRLPDTSHVVKAETIHRIVSLPEGECKTLIIPKGKWREPRFWRFEGYDSVWSRQWNEQEFKQHRLELESV